MENFKYIKQYYQVPAETGRDVLVSGKKATITKDMGNYIGVVFHDDPKFNCVPCHPTSCVIYLETFTDVKKLRCKNHRSKQRYLDYLSSESGYSFGEWLRIKSAMFIILALFLTACSPRVTSSKQIYYNNTLNYLRTRLAEHKIDSAEYKRLIDNRPELAAYFGYKPY